MQFQTKTWSITTRITTASGAVLKLSTSSFVVKHSRYNFDLFEFFVSRTPRVMTRPWSWTRTGTEREKIQLNFHVFSVLHALNDRRQSVWENLGKLLCRKVGPKNIQLLLFGEYQLALPFPHHSIRKKKNHRGEKNRPKKC